MITNVVLTVIVDSIINNIINTKGQNFNIIVLGYGLGINDFS